MLLRLLIPEFFLYFFSLFFLISFVFFSLTLLFDLDLGFNILFDDFSMTISKSDISSDSSDSSYFLLFFFLSPLFFLSFFLLLLSLFVFTTYVSFDALLLYTSIQNWSPHWKLAAALCSLAPRACPSSRLLICKTSTLPSSFLPRPFPLNQR